MFKEGVDYQTIMREYDYRTLKDHMCDSGIIPPYPIIHPFFSLDVKGNLIIFKGYEWDGATRAIDTRDFMRASLFHDCLYQMLRMQYLPGSYRKKADQLLYRLLGEDGMSGFRRWYVYYAVRLLGGFF